MNAKQEELKIYPPLIRNEINFCIFYVYLNMYQSAFRDTENRQKIHKRN